MYDAICRLESQKVQIDLERGELFFEKQLAVDGEGNPTELGRSLGLCNENGFLPADCKNWKDWLDRLVELLDLHKKSMRVEYDQSSVFHVCRSDEVLLSEKFLRPNYSETRVRAESWILCARWESGFQDVFANQYYMRIGDSKNFLFKRWF